MRAFTTLRARLPGWWIVGDFLGWWIAELRATLGNLLSATRVRGSTQFYLHVNGGELIVRQLRRSKLEDIGVLARAAEGHWSTTLDAGDSGQTDPAFAGATLTAVLPASDVLVRKLTLPAAAEKSLDRVLAIQVVREFPLDPRQLYFDHYVAQRLRDTKQIVVHLRAAKRNQIEALSNWAVGVGGRLDRVCCLTEDGETSGNFLPRVSRGGGSHFSSLERGLAIAALLLTVTTAAVVAGQWWFERRQVDAELTRIRTQAQQVRAQWKQIETESAPAADLARLMSVPDAATILGDLPDRIPQDTWISQIEIRTPATTVATLNLSAFAPATSTLVDELGRGTHFQHIHLIYAATDSFGNHGDRVQLSAEWVAPREANKTPRFPRGNSP